MVLGASAEAVAWRMVVTKRANIWAATSVVFALTVPAALLTGRPELSPAVGVGASLAAGLGAGALLYLATRAFVAVIRSRWSAFVRDAGEVYARQGTLTPIAAVALGVTLAGGEEVFWRGLFQSRVGVSAGAAALTWLAFLVVKSASANLAIVAGAVVGGAVWVGLFAWTHGVLAPMCCHGAWTGLMIAVPPVRR